MKLLQAKNKIQYASKQASVCLFIVFLLQSFFSVAQVDLDQSHFTDKNIQLFDRNLYHLSSFTEKESKKIGLDILKQIDPSMMNHPDLGYDVHPIHDEAIELVDRRTDKTSTYILPNGQTIISTSSNPMNYIDEQGWYRSIAYSLNPKPLFNSIYKADKQPIPKIIDASNAKTSFETAIGNFAINQDSKLKYIDEQGNITSQYALETKQRSIGQDGVFYTNAFPQMDMQIILMKNGTVKTNYIIQDKTAIDKNAAYLVMEDYLTLPNGITFDYESEIGIHNGNENDWDGSLVFRNQAGEDVFHYLNPIIYDKSYVQAMLNAGKATYNKTTETIEEPGINSDDFTFGSYRIEKINETTYKISVLVKTSWLLHKDRTFPIVVDPVTFTGSSLTLNSSHCAKRVSGTTPSDNPGPTGVGCYSITSVLPAGYMLAQNQPVNAYSGYRTRGCAASSTWMKYYGPCGMFPRESGFFFFCNTTLTNVDCGAPAGGHAIDGIISRCMTSGGEDCIAATTPSCSDQTITFNMCMQSRCFTEAAGTCVRTSAINPTLYVEGMGFFRVDLIADKISSTLTGGGTVCPNSVNTINLATIYGVPNSLNSFNCTDNMGGTYSWTATITGGGSLSASSGTTNTSGLATLTATMPAAASTVTVTTTVCNTNCSSPAGTMCDVKSVVFNVGNAIAPIVDDMDVCNGVSAVPTVTNTQGGYTYTWENGSNGAGSVIGTGTSRTIAAVNNTTQSYSVRATSPCPSDWENFTITWGPVQPPSTTNVAACPGQSATLTANCGTSCRWYTASSGGASFNNTGSYVINPITSSVTYYVEYNAGAGCVSTRTPVTLSTNALNVTTSPSAFDPICVGSTAGFSSSVTGHATEAIVVINNASSELIDESSTCTGSDCTTANSGSLTLATPAGVPNPLTANSVQSVCFTITGTKYCGSEAGFYLKSPAGTVFTLFSGRAKASSPQVDGAELCFTIGAATTIYAPTTGAPVNIPAGDYLPDGGSLASAFVGETAATGSTWTLYVVDDGSAGSCKGTRNITNFNIDFGVTQAPAYSWSGGPAGGSLAPSASVSGPTFSPPAGDFTSSYTVTVTDAVGCTGTADVSVICTLLPIELISFYGTKGVEADGDRSIYLTWKSQLEINFSDYRLERSEDGIHFDEIAKIAAKGSLSLNEYNYVDAKPLQGENYYRLRMVDLDGEETFSEMISIKASNLRALYMMPNPAKSAIDILYNSPIKTETTIRVFDSHGQLVRSFSKESVKGQNSQFIDLQNFNSGVYQVIVNLNGDILIDRFIKL